MAAQAAEPKRHVWTTEDHDSARADAWAAVQAGVPPFGDSPAERQWLAIAADERIRAQARRRTP